MLLYGSWISLPISIRHKIASEFNITKKGSTHVQDNEIISDGYNIKDIESTLTLDNLQKYVNTDEKHMDILWVMLISKIKSLLNPIEVIINTSEPEKQIIPLETITKPFCDFCSSKGVKHKKDCIKNETKTDS